MDDYPGKQAIKEIKKIKIVAGLSGFDTEIYDENGDSIWIKGLSAIDTHISDNEFNTVTFTIECSGIEIEADPELIVMKRSTPIVVSPEEPL